MYNFRTTIKQKIFLHIDLFITVARYWIYMIHQSTIKYIHTNNRLFINLMSLKIKRRIITSISHYGQTKSF